VRPETGGGRAGLVTAVARFAARRRWLVVASWAAGLLILRNLIGAGQVDGAVGLGHIADEVSGLGLLRVEEDGELDGLGHGIDRHQHIELGHVSGKAEFQIPIAGLERQSHIQDAFEARGIF